MVRPWDAIVVVLVLLATPLLSIEQGWLYFSVFQLLGSFVLIGSLGQGRVTPVQVVILAFVSVFLAYKLSGSRPQDFIALPLLCWLVIIRQHHHFDMRMRGHIAFGLILYFVLTMAAFGSMTHLSRFAALNGDPNHTAALYLAPLFFLFVTTGNRALRALIIATSLMIVLLTLSRAAALAILLFSLVWWCRGLFDRKVGNYLYIVISCGLLISQIIVGLVYADKLAEATADRNLFGLADSSNQGRVLITMQAISLLSESAGTLLFGITNYREAVGSLDFDVHHGALQLAMRYGLLMVLIYHVYMIRYALKRDVAHKAFLMLIMAFSAVLSPAVLYFPTLLLLFIPSQQREPMAGAIDGTPALERFSIQNGLRM